MTTNKATDVTVTQADRDAAEKFGNAWRMNAAGKFGLSNLLAHHRLAHSGNAERESGALDPTSIRRCIADAIELGESGLIVNVEQAVASIMALAASGAASEQPASGEVTKRRVIERAVADDLIRAVYKAEGWTPGDKGGFETRTARCSSVYDITADSRRNRYVATPIAALSTTSEAPEAGRLREAEDMAAFVRECIEEARGDYEGYHLSNKAGEPDLSRYDAALTWVANCEAAFSPPCEGAGE